MKRYKCIVEYDGKGFNGWQSQPHKNTIQQSIEIALKQNRNIELRGFGTFFIKKIKEKYSARNPKTGELIYVPEKNKVRFRASKKLKDFINK